MRLPLLNEFIAELLCQHDYKGYGYSYARCKKCSKHIYAPDIAEKRILEFLEGKPNEQNNNPR